MDLVPEPAPRRRRAGRRPGRAGPAPAALVALALLVGCAALPPWRAGDPAQARSGAPFEATAAAGRVTVRVVAGDWRSWPERLADRVTPLEVVIRNEEPTPLVIRPERFTLEREGHGALPALRPGDLSKALRSADRPLDPDLLAYATRPTRSGVSGVYEPYAWGGLTGLDVATPLAGHGPDPRPAPVGVLEAGRSAGFMVFFDVPGDGLRAFTLAVELVGPGDVPLGTLRFPFRR